MNGLERDELIYVVPLYDIVCQVMEVCVCVCVCVCVIFFFWFD